MRKYNSKDSVVWLCAMNGCVTKGNIDDLVTMILCVCVCVLEVSLVGN